MTSDVRHVQVLSPAGGFTRFSSRSLLHSVIQQTDRQEEVSAHVLHRLDINQDTDYIVISFLLN